MERRLSFTAVCLVLVFSYAKCVAVFRFANIYGDHMVLQQAPHRTTVWGYGEIGREVVLIFKEQMYRSIVVPGSDGSGIWSALLTPTKFGGPYIINAYSVVNETKVSASLQDVLFGDVWICSGQSNMEFTVVSSDNGAKAINESVLYKNIRIFTAEMECSDQPLKELNKIRLPWSRPSPETVGGPAWKYFSAVCWYYGIQLYQKLKYPIGLVASTWGGTPVEAWSSPKALNVCDISVGAQAVTKKRANYGKFSLEGPHNLSCLWNGMVYPFLNMTIYGAIWYQGEENAQRGVYPYNCTFPAMIDDWRQQWYVSTQENTIEVFPFGFVQLSAAGNTTTGQAYHFAPLRWDQTAQFGYVPNARQKNVFMAVAMDLGNPNSPYYSVHPTDKTDVGIRLAQAGFAVAYGESLYYSGPLLSEISNHPLPTTGALEVTFRSVSGAIEVRSQDGFEVRCYYSDTWFAAPIITNSPVSVTIKSPNICEVEAVRYAWSDYPCVIKKCAIYSDDLPSPPFIKYGPF